MQAEKQGMLQGFTGVWKAAAPQAGEVAELWPGKEHSLELGHGEALPCSLRLGEGETARGWSHGGESGW